MAGVGVTANTLDEIVVEITLSPADEGGRLSAIASGVYRGVFSVRAGSFSVRWVIPTSTFLAPGGRSGTFGVQFLVPELALQHFPVGTSFSVWEGRDIGTGVVLQVLQRVGWVGKPSELS